MKRPNPLHPDLMSPAERRAELASLLALGLVRLCMQQSTQLSANIGESSLHTPPDQWRHATHLNEENA